MGSEYSIQGISEMFIRTFNSVKAKGTETLRNTGGVDW
jgi:hypothetical protein